MHIIPDEEDDESFQSKDLIESPSPEENNQDKSSLQTPDSMAA